MTSLHSTTKRSMQQGFTLLELLIALALLSLIMLGLSSVLLTVSKTQTRVEQKVALLDRQHTAIDFLRSILGNVSAQKRPEAQAYAASAQGQSMYVFDAQAQSVEWLGVMPARWGIGGVNLFRLHMRLQATGQELVLAFRPWNEGAASSDNWTEYVLETDVRSFELRYQRAKDGGNWNTPWTFDNELPSAIEIKLATSVSAWPKTVIAMHQAALHHSSQRNKAVFGGSVR